MVKNRDVRILITLECISCAQNANKQFSGISRYMTQKNRRTTPNRLELKKFCSRCCSHTIHREIKR